MLTLEITVATAVEGLKSINRIEDTLDGRQMVIVIIVLVILAILFLSQRREQVS